MSDNAALDLNKASFPALVNVNRERFNVDKAAAEAARLSTTAPPLQPTAVAPGASTSGSVHKVRTDNLFCFRWLTLR